MNLTKSRPHSSPFTSGYELLSEDIMIDYLIQGIIETDTSGQLFGPSGAGKTFVALDMSLCIATGKRWNNREVKQGLVIYFCAEGRAGISRRIKAWCIIHGKNKDDLSLIHISKNTIEFSQDKEETIVMNILAIPEAHEKQVALVVIDTLARHMPSGADENSTKDMSIMIHVVDGIREKLGNCVIMFVHHSGHSSMERARGASALKAALDFEICCKPGELKFTKMKDAEAPESIGFKLKSVIISEDSDIEELNSAVVEYGASAKSKKTDLTATDKIAIELLIETSSKVQEQINNKWACNEKVWRGMFYEQQRGLKPDAKQDSMKQAFNRMKASLSNTGIISIQGENAILLTNEHQLRIFDLINQLQTVHGT